MTSCNIWRFREGKTAPGHAGPRSDSPTGRSESRYWPSFLLGPHHLLFEHWSSLNVMGMDYSLKVWVSGKSFRAFLSGGSLCTSIFSILSHCQPASPLPLRAPLLPHISSLCWVTEATTAAWLGLAFQFEGLSSSILLGFARVPTLHPQCGPMSTLFHQQWTCGWAGSLGGIWVQGHERFICSRFHVTEWWYLIFQIDHVLCWRCFQNNRKR